MALVIIVSTELAESVTVTLQRLIFFLISRQEIAFRFKDFPIYRWEGDTVLSGFDDPWARTGLTRTASTLFVPCSAAAAADASP